MDATETGRVLAKRVSSTPAQVGLARVLYGLPCANCRSYYPAALTECPICHHRERIPAAPAAAPAASRIPA